MSEIFPNATVKEVIFQIQFSNLLFIDKKIGDYQLKIMTEFPESSELIQRQLMFAISDSSAKKEISNEEKDSFQKIWQFNSEKGYVLNVTSNSLSIVSKLHKTYNNPEGSHKFRDVIESSVSAFLNKEIAPIPTIKRIGLRYIDEPCHLPEPITNTTYSQFYKTAFPLNRFDISKAKDMQFLTNIEQEDGISLRYLESYRNQILTIDFDAYKLDINPENYLIETDNLYQVIHRAFEDTIKDPVKTIMRKAKEE